MNMIVSPVDAKLCVDRKTCVSRDVDNNCQFKQCPWGATFGLVRSMFSGCILLSGLIVLEYERHAEAHAYASSKG